MGQHFSVEKYSNGALFSYNSSAGSGFFNKAKAAPVAKDYSELDAFAKDIADKKRKGYIREHIDVHNHTVSDTRTVKKKFYSEYEVTVDFSVEITFCKK